LRSLGLTVVLSISLLAVGASTAAPGRLARIDHVADGDTVDLVNGQRVRLVQIDTPEVYFSAECWGQAGIGRDQVTSAFPDLGSRGLRLAANRVCS
jgi:hypothetical protein